MFKHNNCKQVKRVLPFMAALPTVGGRLRKVRGRFAHKCEQACHHACLNHSHVHRQPGWGILAEILGETTWQMLP